MKQTKPKFSVGQMVNKVLSGEPELFVPVSILGRKWAGHCWYYHVEYNDNQTSWLLESQLAAPLVV